MTDLEYLDRAETLLEQVESSCDRLNDQSGVDIDNQRVGGMITLSFPGGSQIIINLQKPLQEVWMATQAGGFHYRLTQGHWLDTKQGTEFFADLSRFASQQSGLSLSFE